MAVGRRKAVEAGRARRAYVGSAITLSLPEAVYQHDPQRGHGPAGARHFSRIPTKRRISIGKHVAVAWLLVRVPRLRQGQGWARRGSVSARRAQQRADSAVGSWANHRPAMARRWSPPTNQRSGLPYAVTLRYRSVQDFPAKLRWDIAPKPQAEKRRHRGIKSGLL